MKDVSKIVFNKVWGKIFDKIWEEIFLIESYQGWYTGERIVIECLWNIVENNVQNNIQRNIKNIIENPSQIQLESSYKLLETL